MTSLTEMKQRLQELLTRKSALVEKDAELASLETEIAETSASVAELEAAAKQKSDERTIVRLREQEGGLMVQLVAAVGDLDNVLGELVAVQDEMHSVQPGAADRRAVHPGLRVGVHQQQERWRRHRPELLGGAPLPTKGEQRVLDAEQQLANAESRKKRWEAATADQRSTAESKRHKEELAAGVKHAKAVVKWAERHKKERRPSAPPPAYPHPEGTLRIFDNTSQ